MRQTFAALTLVLGLVGASARDASAQLSIYMKVDGIPGSSIDKQHLGWIEVQALRQTQAPDDPKNNPCRVEVLKGFDIAGPRLWQAAVTQRYVDDAWIEVVTAGSEPIKIYEIELRWVKIAGITTEGGNAFVERVTLAAESVTLRYWAVGPDGSTGGVVTTSFRCK